MVREPYPDELISSWLARVASMYGATWDELCRDNGFPEAVDYGNEPAALKELAKLTRMPGRKIEALDLAKRFPRQPLHRFACYLETRQAVADVCGDCLRDDIQAGHDNYIRYQWAIGGVAHCHKHRRLLASKCAYCSHDLDGCWGKSESGIHFCCKVCRQRIAYAAHGKKGAGAVRLDFSLRCERRLITALGGSIKEKRWFGVVEDLAFLAFIANFRDWGRRLKDKMWARVSIPHGMITPALEYDYRSRSAAILYPLSGLESSRRSDLLRWATSYTKSHDTAPHSYLFEFLDIEPTAIELFRALDDAGREEFVSRASRWPEALRKPAREIMYMAVEQSYGPAKYDLRASWAMSYGRRFVNYRKIPRCYPGMSNKHVRRMNPLVDYIYDNKKYARDCLNGSFQRKWKKLRDGRKAC
jgi:TniQ